MHDDVVSFDECLHPILQLSFESLIEQSISIQYPSSVPMGQSFTQTLSVELNLYTKHSSSTVTRHNELLKGVRREHAGILHTPFILVPWS
jgi:hypothetical protein